MSIITNDGLTRSGTGYFIAVSNPYGNSERQRVKRYLARPKYSRLLLPKCSESTVNFIFSDDEAFLAPHRSTYRMTACVRPWAKRRDVAAHSMLRCRATFSRSMSDSVVYQLLCRNSAALNCFLSSGQGSTTTEVWYRDSKFCL